MPVSTEQRVMPVVYYIDDFDTFFRYMDSDCPIRQDGDCESPNGYFMHVRIDGTSHLCDDRLEDGSIHYPPFGHYLVQTDSNGNIFVHTGTELDITRFYDLLNADYSDWASI